MNVPSPSALLLTMDQLRQIATCAAGEAIDALLSEFWSDTFSASPEDMEQAIRASATDRSIAQVIVPFILCAIPLTVKRPIQEVEGV